MLIKYPFHTYPYPECFEEESRQDPAVSGHRLLKWRWSRSVYVCVVLYRNVQISANLTDWGYLYIDLALLTPLSITCEFVCLLLLAVMCLVMSHKARL